MVAAVFLSSSVVNNVWSCTSIPSFRAFMQLKTTTFLYSYKS